MTTSSVNRLVLRPRATVRWLFPCLAALALVATVLTEAMGGLAITVLLAGVALREARISTTADDEGLTVKNS